jgi:fructan beta-fructosidase
VVVFVHNPVLVNEEKIDFRDPKVFWHEQTIKWIMVLATGDCMEIYSSPILKEWQFESSFNGHAGEEFGNVQTYLNCLLRVAQTKY